MSLDDAIRLYELFAEKNARTPEERAAILSEFKQPDIITNEPKKHIEAKIHSHFKTIQFDKDGKVLKS